MIVQFYNQFPGAAHLDPPMKETTIDALRLFEFWLVARLTGSSGDVQCGTTILGAEDHYVLVETNCQSADEIGHQVWFAWSNVLAQALVASVASIYGGVENLTLVPHTGKQKFGALRHGAVCCWAHCGFQKEQPWSGIQGHQDYGSCPTCMQTKSWDLKPWHSMLAGAPVATR